MKFYLILLFVIFNFKCIKLGEGSNKDDISNTIPIITGKGEVDLFDTIEANTRLITFLTYDTKFNINQVFLKIGDTIKGVLEINKNEPYSLVNVKKLDLKTSNDTLLPKIFEVYAYAVNDNRDTSAELKIKVNIKKK